MPATQFRVTDEVGTYLCAVRALVFEGSILAYNPARDETEWVPTCSIANDLSWVEKSAMALANYMPRISQEVACIAALRTHRLMSWPDSSSEEDEQEEEDEHKEAEGQGETGPESPSGGAALEKGEPKQKTKPQRQQRSWELGSIMDEEEPLTFYDPWSDSDATAGGCSPVRLTPQELGLPRETTVEVHVRESEVEEL